MNDQEFYESCTVRVLEQTNGWSSQVITPENTVIFDSDNFAVGLFPRGPTGPFWSKKKACKVAQRWLNDQIFNSKQKWEKC